MATQKASMAAAEADAKFLVERLVGVTDDDHKRFLLKIKNRFDWCGPYESLPYMLMTWVVVRPPTLPAAFFFAASGWSFQRSRMTLLLGAPGSGKTTLLKALAGKLDSGLKEGEVAQQLVHISWISESSTFYHRHCSRAVVAIPFASMFLQHIIGEVDFLLTVSGRVTYNGRGMDEFLPERTAAYVSQDDLHNGEMTVQETLSFSAKCQGLGNRNDLLMELIRREREANVTPEEDVHLFMQEAAKCRMQNVVTNYIMQILGLKDCADTLVGNDMIRGISGGQRKRVTIGEMLVGPARVLIMDEISNGLDSSTAFQIVNSLRQLVHILGGTAVISLLQPAPEIYDLFDDIIFLSEGHVVYQGPKENAVEFFESLGFSCPHRKAISDFLLEWSNSVTPLIDFMLDKQLGRFFDVPFDQNVSSIAALTTSMYGVRKMESFQAVFAREAMLMRRNTSRYIVGFAQITVKAFIALTIFWNRNMHHDSVSDGMIYLGLLFFALSETMFSTLGEIGDTVMKLPLFFKQRDVFFPAWAYALATWIIKIPVSVIDVTIWVAIAYYGVGLDANVGRKFEQVLETLLLDLTANEKKAHGVTKNRLEILKGVSGSFRPGVLTALMGMSGAGKTTLMDVLAGRKTGGYSEGTIRISGYQKKQETFCRVFGYCEQSDIHSPHLTVFETLLFSSWLRLPSDTDSITRKLIVVDVLELLELTSLQGAHVGYAGVNGLSSEQRKRITIAVELVANPSIIFMDEPTSGLDARASAIVMRTVRNLADAGRTVVCTIHQPSIDIFETFDEEIEGVNEIKDGYNPATWMLDVTSTVQEQMPEIDLSEIYKRSELYQTKQQDLVNSVGSMYAAVLMLGIQNASGIHPVVAMERILFYKERAAGMYSALPYAFAQVAIELPYIFIQTLIYGVLVTGT
ncbi:hypothetical protein PR202_gb16803 [Eleusine coracana subsp. coracana]|uniref:ABC transporter domain-containing protein n=1 Tax=Eleusine coracana subsp. coracana TaxID=191504 RepID=A0AAV5F185_ELECO|nr:hypothetical protein PR202_gb16745 [Eleusine coracana subsp. coracana]GJN28653.1 hypothetical protein PR202_gb16803 [Eleusine coracana subsp. coracana]